MGFRDEPLRAGVADLGASLRPKQYPLHCAIKILQTHNKNNMRRSLCIHVFLDFLVKRPVLEILDFFAEIDIRRRAAAGFLGFRPICLRLRIEPDHCAKTLP